MDLLVIGGIIYENSTSFPKSKIQNPKSQIRICGSFALILSQ